MSDSNTPETFSTRFLRLKEASGLSYDALSKAIAARTGITISNNALHKYASGGNIDEPNLEALCEFFGKTPAWFRYGIEPGGTNTFEVLGEMVQDLAPEPQQMVLQLLKYEFADNASRVISDSGTSVTYNEFLDRVIKDMEAKRRAAKTRTPQEGA